MGCRGGTRAPNLNAVGDHEVPDGGVVHALSPLYRVINAVDCNRHSKRLAVVRVRVVRVPRVVLLQPQAPVGDLVSEPLRTGMRSGMEERRRHIAHIHAYTRTHVIIHPVGEGDVAEGVV